MRSRRDTLDVKSPPSLPNVASGQEDQKNIQLSLKAKRRPSLKRQGAKLTPQVIIEGVGDD